MRRAAAKERSPHRGLESGGVGPLVFGLAARLPRPSRSTAQLAPQPVEHGDEELAIGFAPAFAPFAVELLLLRGHPVVSPERKMVSARQNERADRIKAND